MTRVYIDWIAHGIIDSIIDAFFPVLGVIEREVEHLDSSILQPSSDEAPKSDTGPQFTTEKTLTNIIEVDENDKERMSENDVGRPHHFTPSSHLNRPVLCPKFEPTTSTTTSRFEPTLVLILYRYLLWFQLCR